jgi:hypothetical protein
VSTFPLTSSNSTKPGHFSDSDSKRAKPASGLPLLMYLEYMNSQQFQQEVLTNKRKLRQSTVGFGIVFLSLFGIIIFFSTFDVGGGGVEFIRFTYSILVLLHFKELKLSEAYTETVIRESLFLL